MKRILLALTTIVLALMLVACSDAMTDSSSSSTSTTTTTTATATSLTDTSGNTIYSGSAYVSYVYNSNTTTVSISAAYLIDGVTVEIDSGTYASASSSSDQVVFLVVNGGKLTVTGTSSSPVTITKTGSAASGQVGDDYNFYGINSAIVVAGSSSSATLEYVDIQTDANGANAVMSTNGATITISNSTITSEGDAGARGLHATYDGIINASNVEITTQGSSCAAIATDRGGGTITATSMTLETNSAGSPLIYSTDSITVTNSTGSANKAQMVVVEGGSEAHLTDCTFTCSGDGNRTAASESNSSSHVVDACGIFIYQSVSGDSSEGTDYFSATDCSLTVTGSSIPMFYLTNITAEITLSGNTLTQASSSDYFIMCEESDWGTDGSNGATVTLDITGQDLASLTSTKAYVGSSSSLNGGTGLTIN